LTGGEWKLDLQDCGGERNQRVGFLWRDDRVRLSDQADLWQLNGSANGPDQACKGLLRPGRLAKVESRRKDGAAFQALTLHLDWGEAESDYHHRRIAQRRIASLTVGGKPLLKEAGDLIILGDFNVGCWGEMELLDDDLKPGYQRLLIERDCSQAAPVDLIVVSSRLADDLPSAIRPAACRNPDQDWSTFGRDAHNRLSDHLPVLVDLPDRRRPR
jgi:hypothetical protein